MKKLVTILFIVLSSSTIFSQDIIKIPFHGANTIVIKTQTSDDSLYIMVGKKLAASGFSIDINNRDFLQFKTGKKDTAYPDLVYVLTVSVSNKEAFIKPTMISKGYLGIYDWTYRKSKLTADYAIHQEVLKALDGLGEVLYTKR